MKLHVTDPTTLVLITLFNNSNMDESHASIDNAAGPSQELNEPVPAATAQITEVNSSREEEQNETLKRKGDEQIINDDTIKASNEAKRSKLTEPSSSLQVLVSTVSRSNEDASPQHQLVKNKADFDTKAEDGATGVASFANNDEETSNMQQIKDTYEQYVSKVKASGSSIEKEMTKQTDLLYVVTSISRRDCDPLGPCLHGIYTTCKNAQQAARKAFEKASDSYRNGEFVSHEGRVANFDMTNFLIPGVKGACRLLFEVFKPDGEYPEDCTGVAMNTVRIGTDVEQRLPYIKDSLSDWICAGLDADILKEDSEAVIEKNSKVHALFGYKACGRDDEMDVDLIGIYKGRETAVNRARAYTQDFVNDDQVEVSYNLEVTDGEIIVVEGKVSVSIETVILDDEDDGKYGNEIEFSIL